MTDEKCEMLIHGVDLIHNSLKRIIDLLEKKESIRIKPIFRIRTRTFLSLKMRIFLKSLGINFEGGMKKFTPIRAIRVKCLDCASSQKMVKGCQEVDCPLHFFRLGHNPRRKGIGRIGGNPSLCKK